MAIKVLQQKKRLQIPRGIKPLERENLAKDIINFIRKRSVDDNLDKANQPLAEYSEEYAKEKGSSRVNLTLSGDMLDNLKLLRTYSGSVTIGYDEDYDGMGKVHGNRNGTYGQDAPIPGKARDFLDLTEADLNDLVAKYKVNDRDAELEEDAVVQSRELSRDVIERLRRENFMRSLGLPDVSMFIKN